jgi:thioesterase domain-containing protein
VRQEFHKEVPLASVLRHATIEQMAAMLRKDVSSLRGSALVPIQPKGAKPPIFCVPGAGGNAIYLHNLARELGQDQPFYGLQGRGMDGEAAPHSTVEAMADYYLDAIRVTQPEGPYHLAGHSLGGWVAFEMADRLRQVGQEVAFLAIIDTPVPSPKDTEDRAAWDDARWIAELAQRIAQLMNPGMVIREEALRGLEHATQMESFRDALIAAGVFPEEAGTDGLEHTLALFKAHANVRYSVEGKRAQVRLQLYRTVHAPPHRPELVDDETWGWARTGEVDVMRVPGEHLSVLRPPHVARLAEAMLQMLEQPDDTPERARLFEAQVR